MSHFYTLVIVPSSLLKLGREPDEAKAKELIDVLLAPYNEALKVPPYERKCSCMGMAALRDAMLQAEKQLGTIDSFRDSFNKQVPLPGGIQAHFELAKSEMEARQKKWEACIKPLLDLGSKLEKEHPLYGKPDPNCQRCSGKGVVMSDRNPRSKWDWYTIGGRWDKALGHENIRSIAKLGPDTLLPHAIVTPEGEWIEKGRMGLWAVVFEEKPKDEWHDTVFQLFDKYKDAIGIVVDCHI